MMIIFSTCWYILKAKFNKEIYQVWIDNFLANVNNFYLVIYTNNESYYMLEKYITNPRIKIIIFQVSEFYNYKYKDYWIKNHAVNNLLNINTSWQLNMLWSEKISFVKKSFDEKYFINSESFDNNSNIEGIWYGWCDIGYFRGRPNDLPINIIKEWPNKDKIKELNQAKIYYAKVNNNITQMNNYIKNILSKNQEGLPTNPIDPNQVSIAGGFFLIYNTNIDWWHNVYDTKLRLYFENNRLVKDDQIIVLDSIVTNMAKFILVEERNQYDNWFMFQRYLL